MSSYTLTYSFAAPTGLALAPKYVDGAGTVGAPIPVAAHFEAAGWYGFTLTLAAGYRGYLGFFDPGGVPAALFAVNPEEGENLDAKVSTLDAVGPGGTAYSTVVADVGNRPIVGASVWVTSDAGGQEVVAGTLITGSTGVVTFELAPGSYFLWRRHAQFNFPNPLAFTVN